MIGQQQGSYWYLASPYSHPESHIRRIRYERAEDALVWLLAKRIWSYSPIVHLHPLAEYHELPKDAGFWEDYNHLMISRSDGLIVLRIDGWLESKGVTEERGFATQLRKPVFDLIPMQDGFALA